MRGVKGMLPSEAAVIPLTLLAHNTEAADPAICDPAVCGGLSDHPPIRATVRLR